MKTHLLLIAPLFTAALQAADLPTGQKAPEGVACDAVMAYIKRDSKAWLATLVRPIYGETATPPVTSRVKSRLVFPWMRSNLFSPPIYVALMESTSS